MPNDGSFQIFTALFREPPLQLRAVNAITSNHGEYIVPPILLLGETPGRVCIESEREREEEG